MKSYFLSPHLSNGETETRRSDSLQKSTRREQIRGLKASGHQAAALPAIYKRIFKWVVKGKISCQLNRTSNFPYLGLSVQGSARLGFLITCAPIPLKKSFRMRFGLVSLQKGVLEQSVPSLPKKTKWKKTVTSSRVTSYRQLLLFFNHPPLEPFEMYFQGLLSCKSKTDCYENLWGSLLSLRFFFKINF